MKIFDHIDLSSMNHVYLDMSHNRFELFFTYEIESQHFSEKWLKLKYINFKDPESDPDLLVGSGSEQSRFKF